MTTTTSQRPTLVDHLLELFSTYQQNRRVAEEKWQENIDAYHCVAGEEHGQKLKTNEGKDGRSRTRLAVTRQKISNAVAVICDITLSGGKIPYLIKLDDEFQNEEDLFADPLGKMTKVVDSQLERTRAEREYFRCVWSAAIYGETWKKNVLQDVTVSSFQEIPVPGDLPPMAGGLPPQQRRYMKISQVMTIPSFKFVNPWNMYWDVEARDVENMEGMFHYVPCSPYDLRKMIGRPGVIKANVLEAIREADNFLTVSGSTYSSRSAEIEPRVRDISKRRRTIWQMEFWGRAPRRKVEEFEREVLGMTGAGAVQENISTEGMGEANDGDDVYIMAVLANEQIIRFMRVKPEDNPFDRALFEEDLESPFGRSPADNLRNVQSTLDGAVRLFEDNKKLTANLIAFVKRRYLKNKTLDVLDPGKIYDVAEECDDVRKAVYFPTIPDVGATVLDFINLYLQFADDESSIPRITQGLPSVADMQATATEVNTRAEQAHKYLGMAIRYIDGGIIERGIGWILDCNLNAPEHADYSGPYHIQATGFSSFQSRYVRIQKLQQLFALVISDPELAALCKLDQMLAELFKISDVDPEQFLRSPQEIEQKQAEEQQAQQEMMLQEAALKQPQPDLTAEAQNAELAARAQATQMDAQTRAQQAQEESQRRTAQAQTDAQVKTQQAQAGSLATMHQARANAEARMIEARAKADEHKAQAEKARAEAAAIRKGGPVGAARRKTAALAEGRA
jgi:hypothetical protein